MQDTIWQRIAAVSWWEYAFYLYLFYLCYQARLPHKVNIHSYFVTGMVSGLMALCIVFLTADDTLFKLTIFALSVTTGYLVGLSSYLLLKIRAAPNENALQMRGSWLWLIALIVFIFSRFYAHTAIVPTTHNLNPLTVLYLVAGIGFFAGTFLGRYRYAKHCVQMLLYTN